MIIKLLGPFIGFLISVSNIILHKTKGKSFSIVQWILISLLFILSITVSIVIVNDTKDEKFKVEQLEELVIKSDESNRTLRKLNDSDSLTISLLKKQISNSNLNEEQAQKERKQLKALLEPFEKLAIEKYPNYKLKNALDKIIQDLDILGNKTEYLEKNAQKMNYKTLDESIKKTVIKELIEIIKVSEAKFEDVDFKIDFGTIGRVKNTGYVIRDLRGIFTEAGYNVSQPSNAMVIDNNLKIYKYPVIIVNPKYKELAINITLSLNKFLTNLKYVTDSNNKYSTLKFQFYGIPEFSEDGSVKYQQ